MTRFSNVTEESIACLIDTFYAKVRSEERLGPIFESVIADERWPEHLATMRAFWSSVMLTTGRYKGNPMLAHLRLKMVRPDDLERWLGLFMETSNDVFDSPTARQFQEKAARIAQSLSMGLFYRPEDHAPRSKG